MTIVYRNTKGTALTYAEMDENFNYLEQFRITTGMILLWSGSSTSIPSGWALCNGSNGTPNLQDRFIVGAGSSYAVGSTGGSANAIVVAHTHTGTTISNGDHKHSTFSYLDATSTGDNITASDTGGNDEGTLSTKFAGETNTTGAHTHTFTTDSTGSSNTNANLPPYYALAYIMKL
jgi:hypothetical protein